MTTVKLKVYGDESRDKLVLALTAAGLRVWVEVPVTSSGLYLTGSERLFYVCFELDEHSGEVWDDEEGGDEEGTEVEESGVIDRTDDSYKGLSSNQIESLKNLTGFYNNVLADIKKDPFASAVVEVSCNGVRRYATATVTTSSNVFYKQVPSG